MKPWKQSTTKIDADPKKRERSIRNVYELLLLCRVLWVSVCVHGWQREGETEREEETEREVEREGEEETEREGGVRERERQRERKSEWMREKKVFLFEKFFLFFFFSSLKANEKGIMQHICGCDKDRAREDFFNLGIASLSLSLSHSLKGPTRWVRIYILKTKKMETTRKRKSHSAQFEFCTNFGCFQFARNI